MAKQILTTVKWVGVTIMGYAFIYIMLVAAGASY